MSDAFYEERERERERERIKGVREAQIVNVSLPVC